MTENDIQRKEMKLKKNYYEAPSESELNSPEKQAESPSPAISQPALFYHRRDLSRTRRQYILVTAGWLIFIGLGAVLLYFRFFSDLPGLAPDSLKRYGMIAVGIAYVLSILLAIKDNMFDGLLAIVVPFYPFYYLFFTSGSIILRAFTAALLAAFGFDCLLFIQNIVLKFFERISYWIQHV